MADTDANADGVTTDEQKRDAVLKAKAAAPSQPLDQLISPDRLSALEKTIHGYQAYLVGAEKVAADNEAAISRRYNDRMEHMIAQEGATLDSLKPWNEQEESAKYKTDLWSQFGSPGFIIAMLGSAFTAQPMISALNSGAAAMNAINQGDLKAHDRAMQAWKDNTDLAIKRMNMEHEEYQDINKLRESNLAEWQARMKIAAARFQDQATLAMMEAGMYPQIEEKIAGIADARVKLENSKNAIEENNLRRQLVNSFLKPGDYADPKKVAAATRRADEMIASTKAPESPANQLWQQFKLDNPNASLDDQLEFFKKLTQAQFAGRYGGVLTEGREKAQAVADRADQLMEQHKGDPNYKRSDAIMDAEREVKQAFAPPMTEGKRYDVEAHLGLYDDAVKLIDQVTGTLDKYVGAAGIAGRATRLGERVSNLTGGTQTDRVQLMRDIEQLQLMGPQLLLDRNTGRPLSTEAGKVSDIIAGLNIGDTTANTLRAMKEIRDRLTAIRDRDKARLGGTTQSPAAASPAAAAPSENWDSFPAASPTVH